MTTAFVQNQMTSLKNVAAFLPYFLRLQLEYFLVIFSCLNFACIYFLLFVSFLACLFMLDARTNCV
jgi:hypothetical protein